jgi:hypothetical protein
MKQFWISKTQKRNYKTPVTNKLNSNKKKEEEEEDEEEEEEADVPS